MKKQILILSLLASGTAFAQIPKGSIFGGLTLSVWTQKHESENKSGNKTTTDEPIKSMSWEVMPEASYFVADNLAIGLGIGMNGYKQTSTSTPNATTKTESSYKSGGPAFSIFARKFFPVTENFYCFGGFGFDFSSGKGEDEEKTTTTLGTNTTTITTTTKSKSTNMGIGLNAGLAYNVTPKIMLIGSFGLLSWYSNTSKTNMEDDPTNGESYDLDKYSGIAFGVNTGQTPFNLGFVYLLNAPN